MHLPINVLEGVHGFQARSLFWGYFGGARGEAIFRVRIYNDYYDSYDSSLEFLVCQTRSTMIVSVP